MDGCFLSFRNFDSSVITQPDLSVSFGAPGQGMTYTWVVTSMKRGTNKRLAVNGCYCLLLKQWLPLTVIISVEIVTFCFLKTCPFS